MDSMNLWGGKAGDFWNRKILLYGNEKIKKDIDYLFGFRGLDLEICGSCSDACFVKPGKEDCLIVLCEKEMSECFDKHAAETGMIDGQDYMYASSFFLYYNPIFMNRKDRKIAVWGTGICADILWSAWDKMGIVSEIDFYIDNANDKTIFKGKQVVSPKEIVGRKDLYIVVATSRHAWEIYQQLDEYGFLQDSDYIYYDLVSRDYGELLEKVCFTERKYPYRCHRPFGYCDVADNNLYLCCFLRSSIGTIAGNSFMDCWHSCIAQILRLSVLNGTFVFCDKEYCDLFDFNQDIRIENKIEENYAQEPLTYPGVLMVGIDYTCNLTCPSCRRELRVATGEQKKELERSAEHLLEQVIPYVNRLWLGGTGETFFSEIYRKILDDKRCRKRSSIGILSNGTLFCEENWKHVEESYKSIEVVVSLDGIKDATIEKLRRGSNPQKLKQNLEFLGTLRKNNKLKRFIIRCVLQAENVAELYDLLEYCRRIGVDKVIFQKLQDWGTYEDATREFDEISIFNKTGDLKEKYKSYFTEALLFHPLADWTNNTGVFGLEKKEKVDQYDVF